MVMFAMLCVASEGRSGNQNAISPAMLYGMQKLGMKLCVCMCIYSAYFMILITSDVRFEGICLNLVHRIRGFWFLLT
jgi:hypothetical protein